jgi:hypothetical protein
MSTSCAPSRTACAVSATFAAVVCAPEGKPTTVHTMTPCSGRSGRRDGEMQTA